MQQSYTTILFDLDGTLTESAEGITNAAAFALEHYGIIEDKEHLRRFIGPPLLDSFRDFYGFDDEQAHEAVLLYRNYYESQGLFENRAMDGIVPMLLALKQAGKHLLVATSKPEYFSNRILERYGMLPYFDYVAGATMDEKRSAKADVIAYALDHLPKDCPKDSIVMVGDREHDVIGAKANGIDSVGVTYGYGSRDELVVAGATHIAESVAGLQELLLNEEMPSGHILGF